MMGLYSAIQVLKKYRSHPKFLKWGQLNPHMEVLQILQPLWELYQI